MPENLPTLLGWKRRIADHCETHGIQKSDSAMRRMAARLHKRQELISNDEFRRLFDHADPMANAAIRNVMHEQKKKTAPMHPRQEIRTEAVATTH